MDTQTHNIIAPKAGSKQAKLVAMLMRKSGTTLGKASQALSWQKHTTIAAMTGLRKRGYQIKRQDRGDKPSLYVIVNDEA